MRFSKESYMFKEENMTEKRKYMFKEEKEVVEDKTKTIKREEDMKLKLSRKEI